jgi:hypothetical protein
VRQTARSLAVLGKGVVMVQSFNNGRSGEPEIMALCKRISVFRHGENQMSTNGVSADMGMSRLENVRFGTALDIENITVCQDG